MHLSIALLALSTLAAAGPLPSFANTTLKANTPPSIQANITVAFNPVAALAKLEATYDRLNKTERKALLDTKDEFKAWLNENFDNPENETMSLNSRDDPNGPYEKRSPNEKREALFFKWLKSMFTAPGLKARSSDDRSPTDSEPGLILP